jgi:rod shape-determining protein MreB
MDKLMTKALGANFYVAEDAISCVARGTGKAFESLDKLLDGFEHISLLKYS